MREPEPRKGDPAEIGARWHSARAKFLDCMDAIEAAEKEAGDSIPRFPLVAHGKRGRAFLSADEIDRDRRLRPATKERLKTRLRRAVEAYEAGRQRFGLDAMERATEAASAEMGELGHALAADRSGTPQAILAKLRVLALEIEDGGDMSGYAKGLLAAALADAEAMAAAAPSDLSVLHREWMDLTEQADQRHNGPRDCRPPYPDYDRIGELEEAIAHHPDNSLNASAMRLDVALGTFVCSVMCGETEMLEEGAIAGAVRALEACAAKGGGMALWTPQARQRGLSRLAAWRAKEAEQKHAAAPVKEPTYA